MYPYGAVLTNKAPGCHGVTVMVVRWMEPMFLAITLEVSVGAWGWLNRNRGGPGVGEGWVGLLHVEGERADWTEES